MHDEKSTQVSKRRDAACDKKKEVSSIDLFLSQNHDRSFSGAGISVSACAAPTQLRSVVKNRFLFRDEIPLGKGVKPAAKKGMDNA